MQPTTLTSPSAQPAEPGTHRYEIPRVRSSARPTAHPAAEAWPGEPAEVRYASLQRRLPAALAPGARERSIVVVPSRSLDKDGEPVAIGQAYEERLLCSLLELGDPRVFMTYVTAAPVAAPIVDYYLSLLPRQLRDDARRRLTLVALGDRTPRPLSAKLLERHDVLGGIRRRLVGRGPAYLVPYNTTHLERDVALALGIPMYGADPRHAFLGTKSGARALFARAGVPHPAGAEGVRSSDDVVDAIVRLRAARPQLEQVVLKLNDGVSGEGNALIDLRGLRPPGEPHERERARERVVSLRPEAPGLGAAAFLAKLGHGGGVIEEWIAAREIRSPSVQLQITPEGEVRVVSTHDQILGGATGQSYLGCRFPAEPSYAPMISSLGLRVGSELAASGVVGRLAIDFVVARDGVTRPWRPFAIELNLRKGGTTHPYETLAHLTGGSYDPASASFLTPLGQEKHYVATDHLEAPELRRVGCHGVLARARSEGFRFDPLRRAGTVFHMLSSVDECGRTGFTAIADSAEEAEALYQRVGDELPRGAASFRRRRAARVLAGAVA